MNSTDKSHLKVKAHRLKAIVRIGQLGLTEAVLAEIQLALVTHELIKIKINANRDQRKEISQQICKVTQAELLQTIGQMLIIYRKNPDEQ
jgi:RNA-binding protein